MKNTDYILYLDMDGVLVDYSAGWWAVADKMNLKADAKGFLSKEDSGKVAQVVSTSDFWANLGWEKGGEKLWEIARRLFDNVHILTSTAAKKDNEYHKIVAKGKVEWLVDHTDISPANIHIVTEGLRKAEFATPMSILVDDRKPTIDAFIKAGGYGILHDSRKYRKTLDDLRDIAAPSSLGEIARSLPINRRGFWNGK